MEAQIQQPGTPVPLPRKDVSVLGPLGEQIEASRDLSDKIGVTADIEKLAFSGMTASRIAEALKEKLEVVKSQAEGNPDSPYRDTAYFVRHVRMSLGVPPVENEAKFNAWKEQAPTRLKEGVATVQPSAQGKAATSQASVQPATDKKASDNTIESNEIFTASQADIKPIVPQDIEKHYLRVGGKFYNPKNTGLVAFEDKGNKLETRSNSEHIAESHSA